MMPLVGGFGVSYEEYGDTAHAFGALVLFTAPHRAPCHVETVQMAASNPDARGEASDVLPVLHALWQRLPRKPLVLFLDGEDRLWPAREGPASLAGEAFGVRTVAVAKDRCPGQMAGPLGGPDDAVPVHDHDGAFLGHAWRPAPPAHRPVFVGVGHALPPVGALALVRAWTRKGQAYPEPLCAAEHAARRLRTQVVAPPLAV